jgi:hypothetical protein
MEKNAERKKVIDRRSIKLENVMKPGYIPLGSGRPIRDTIIGKDDLMNLEIILNTSKTADEFIKNM